MAKEILIADNEPSIVISLKSLLEREGYEVIVAYDETEALARVRAEQSAPVILDIMMPSGTVLRSARIRGSRICAS